MAIHNDLAQAIGNTPLIRLNAVSEATGCEILGKAEFMNPGQSVKDRAALSIIRHAVASGQFEARRHDRRRHSRQHGYWLGARGGVDGVQNGDRDPRNPKPREKRHADACGRRACPGACCALSKSEQLCAVFRASGEKLAKTEPNGAIWANQFDNVANRQAHVETTGPEIWEQTGGKVDAFICAAGSGGTVAGVGEALQPKGVQVGLVDPMGAALYSFYTTGEFKSEGGSISEGIGQGRITANLEGFTPDFVCQATDQEALPYVFDLLADEGLCLGGSSGVNIAGAVKMAQKLGPGHTIVTILCDYGTRYQSKLFNPEFLRSKNLPVPAWLDKSPADLPTVFEEV